MVREVKPVLPEVGFIRLSQVLKIIPVSRSSWFAGQAEGRFPKPVSLGPRTRAYRCEHIRALIANPEAWEQANG